MPSFFSSRKEISTSFAIIIFSLSVSSFIVFAQERKELPSPQGCVSAPSDLISWWNGDAVSGKTATDVKSGSNGTISGGVSVVSGKVRSALKFDGSSGSINMGNPAGLNFGTGPFSLEAWFIWDGKGSGVNNIIRKSNYPSSGPGSGYWVRIGRDSKTIEFSTGATTGPEGQSIIVAPITPSVWHHVAATRDNSGAMKLYIDGRPTGTFLRQALNTETTSDAPFTLGSWYGRSEFFSGVIDEVSVYNRALGQSEIIAIYKAGNRGKCSLEEKGADVCPRLQPIDCLPKHHHKTITTPEGCTVLTCVPNISFTYPVAELGNCKDESSCRAYCEKSDDVNVVKACVAFAEKYSLISKDELDIMKKLLELGYTKGPGGCKDQKQCEAYCEDTAHINECLAFAEKLNLLSPDELAEAKKVADALGAGAKLPGGCKDKSSCESYCEDLNHLAECIEFAEKSRIGVKYDLDMARKIVKAGVTKTPGSCKTKDKCEAYCGIPQHLGECADFGEKIGIMSKEDAVMARKIARSGVTEFPGGCKDKEACDIYCQTESHFDECVDFALKAGMMDETDAEFARKTHGKTPGDCAKGAQSAEQGKKACSAYCAKSENQQTCMDFAVQIGLITAQDAKELGGGGSLEDLNLCMQHMDQETLKCFDILGKDMFEKIKAGELPDAPSDLQKMMKGMKEVKACMNKKTDETLGQLPPGGLACLEKEFGENPIEKIKSGKVSCQKFSGMQDRMKTCFSEIIDKQLDACLALSCSEASACLKKFSGGQKADQSQLDPAFKKKIEDKLNLCIENQINECLVKDCSEVSACFDKLKGGEGGEKTEGKLDSGLEAKITEKITGCFKVQKGGAGQFPKTNESSSGTPPSGGEQQMPDYKIPEYKVPEYPVPGAQPSTFPTVPPGTSVSDIPVTPEICANFANIPACSYAGSPDSQNYQLCKKCLPDK